MTVRQRDTLLVALVMVGNMGVRGTELTAMAQSMS